MVRFVTIIIYIRDNDADAMINIFDNDDKTSKLPVIVSLLDSFQHYAFHLTETRLLDYDWPKSIRG